MTDLARYVGTDRKGTARCGAIDRASAAEWLEGRFAAGWRRVTVYSGRDLIGEIGPEIDRPERRTWWVEMTAPAQQQSPRLVNVGSKHRPAYSVVAQGREVGRVSRTGSLPSCYRWWADGVQGSFRTRAAAVSALVGSVTR